MGINLFIFRAMKVFQTILALTAFFALLDSCVHADEHHHEHAAAAVCAVDHCACHSCSETPCSQPEPVVQNVLSSLIEVPVRLNQLIAVFEQTIPVSTASLLPPGELQLIQTVQLLI